jgi:glycosyltransferase involved in cell wall biosynthesis
VKVLHIIDSAGLYGAEAVLLSLAAAQRARGLDACIGAIVMPGESERGIEMEAHREKIPVCRLETRAGLNPSALSDTRRLLRKETPRVVHTHGFKADVLAALQPRRRRAFGLVATLHGWTAVNRLSHLYLYETLDRLSLSRMDIVVPVAERLRSIPAVKRLKSCRVIPNGVGAATNESVEDVAHLTEFCQREPTLLAVGRLSHEKNQIQILKAVAAARSDGLNVQALLLGEGPLRSQLEAAAVDLGIAEAVLMPGYVRNPARLHRFARALVLTSVTEGLPVVVLEAMRDRLPVIATRVGDVPEALNSCGWLLRSAETKTVLESVRQVLSDDAEVARRVMAGRQRWFDRYSLDRMVSQYSEAYDTALRLTA